ncbi:MAG: phenylalanine--tRNA ligase subunit beta [Deltaproteobacteria bacterium]|nr:phenylalanine--tRNA ligase subunit beta [Deltaproteobacteria bacterium]MBN2673451.1 phenylalanine--tRNA ligase subunit beta [Deltaproteobacteria bacterium]
MLASYKWLCELAGFAPDPKELEEKFTFSGLEVASVVHRKSEFDHIVVAEVVEKEAHPDSKKLSLVKVSDGSAVLPIVCGASNCPLPGGRVVLAKEGARFGDFVIEPRKVGGYESFGMLCSEEELNLGPDSDGIIVLEGVDASLGTPIAEALQLEDWIFELEVTPNRPDALYHRGLAREMCLLFDKPFAPTERPAAPLASGKTSDVIHVTVENATGAPRYAASVVENVTVQASPFWLRYRLHNLDIRPISNLVDMTNAILMEYGQPLHAFDLDKLAGKKIVVRNAAEGEKMRTLDDVERTFSTDDLLICDGAKPVAVAGVMGGLDTEVSNETRNILIECAYFNPSNVRKTSKKLKLSSESSYRFERGVDPNHEPEVLAAANAMVCELSGGKAREGIVDCYPKPIAPIEVIFRPSRYAAMMGHQISSAQMVKCIEGIGAEVTVDGENYIVRIPTHRPDMEREIDVIEEIARVTGMNQIEAMLPQIQCQIPRRGAFENVKRAKECLSALGLMESVTYSFVPKEILRSLGVGDELITVANPLNAQRAAMRTTLFAGLLENLKRTHSRYMDSFAQFEVAKTYHSSNAELPTEVVRVAAVLDGYVGSWVSESSRRYDFYDAKGIVDSFCCAMTGRSPDFTVESGNVAMHPKRTLAVSVNGVTVGVLGEIHPAVLKELKLSSGAVGFELDLEMLCAQRAVATAVPLSDFPPMARDVAVVADEAQDVGPILAAFAEAGGDLVTGVKLFDVYRGEHVEKGKKSIAFSVQYRSFEKTLTDKEVDMIHQKAVSSVSEQYNVQLR